MEVAPALEGTLFIIIFNLRLKLEIQKDLDNTLLLLLAPSGMNESPHDMAPHTILYRKRCCNKGLTFKCSLDS